MTEETAPKERREQRRRALGIDCVDHLTWKEWEPGKEYTRKILVKNIDSSSQTILLTLPVNRRTFLTPFPEPITLSSGVSHEISISFRPTEFVELHDGVTISVEGRGSFQVRLDCLTPYAKLSLPSSHDFGYCAVGATAHAQVELRNTGTAPVEFSWEVPVPFCVLPSHAVLDQGEVMHVTILFTPTEACAMVAQAVCRLTGTDDVISTLRISGIGKHPYICFQEATAEEGTMMLELEAHLNGATSSKIIHLSNPSLVPVSVRIRRADENLMCAFHLVAEGEVTLDHDDPTTDDAFLLPSGAVQPLRIHYTPGSPGVIDFNTFQIDCAHGNSLRVDLCGTTIGPRVTASVSYVDFGAVDLDHMPTVKQRTRHVTLKNLSKTDAPFSWMHTMSGAAFVVEPCMGVIAAQSTIVVAITFEPSHPILYHRCLYLIVEGAKDAIKVDVLGGGYTSAIRPPTMTFTHVEAARLRAARGLGLLTPDEMEDVAAAAAASPTEMDAKNGWPVHGSRVGPKTSVQASTVDLWRSVEEDMRNSGVVIHGAKRKVRVPLSALEVANGTVTIDTPFGMDAKSLYILGGTSTGSEARAQLVTVMNTSNVTAVATWSLPSQHPYSYSVVPIQQIVPPHGSAVFQLQHSFTPDDDQPVTCTMECYVNFESMSTFYMAPEGCVSPPQCFTVMCTTASSLAASSGVRANLPSQQQQQASSCIRGRRQVSFPACRPGGTSYQVIALQNKSTMPARYELAGVSLKYVSAVEMPSFSELVTADRTLSAVVTTASGSRQPEGAEAGDAIFSVYPTAGVVPAQGRQLLLVKFSPRETAQYAATAALQWNGSPSPSGGASSGSAAPSAPADISTISFLGEVCLPQLQWRRPGEDAPGSLKMISFPPSCISGEAQQTVWMHNPTSLPVEFHFDTSESLLGVLRMEPEWGVLPGRSRLPVNLFFSPQQPRHFDGSLYLYVQDGSIKGSANREDQQYRQHLRITGEGAHADVEVEPRIIDDGEAADTREQQAALTVYNSGLCDVQYDIRAMPVRNGKLDTVTTVLPRLHNRSSCLPARTHTTVLVSAQPVPGLTEFIVYAIVSGLSTKLQDVADAATVEEAERHPHCRWRLRAAYPAVQVMDVFIPGVARPLAWQQLSLNAINCQLSTAAGEPVGSGEETDAFSFHHYVTGLEPIAMDLGVAHEGDSAVCATLILKNTGDCPAPFDVMLPTEHEANTELWGLENTELADLHYILDRKLVSVNPRQGIIAVGELQELEVRYVHDEIGVHRLPMLLRVGQGGRRVAVVLEGRTLPAEVQALNFHHEKTYELAPVALGDLEPPLQFVLVTNPFEKAIAYTVDVAALEEHSREHYGFPIFQCADPEGTVAPHSTAYIGFYFRPLEAKTYRVSVLVQTQEGEGYFIDLTGTGYHPHCVAKSSAAQWIDQALMQVPPPSKLSAAHAHATFVSDDMCTFGAVPYFSLCRRTSTLQLSMDCPTAMRYAWRADLPHRGDAQAVVTPAEGLLQPGESVTFKVLFYAGSTSQVLERLLTCAMEPCASGQLGEDKRRVASAGRLGRRTTATPRISAEASRRHSNAVTVMNLLIQARVIPREDYESIYGAEKLNSKHMPALYDCHVDPTSAVSSSASKTAIAASSAEAGFVRDVMDELIRSVVATPAVQSSFTALCAPRQTTYASMRVLRSAKAAKMKAPAAAVASAQLAVKGTAAIAAEEVLEDLLCNLVRDAVAAA